MPIKPWSKDEDSQSNQSVLLRNGTKYKFNFPG